jgi:cobalt-precorrin-5B (C1)-methyltransferase
MRRTGITTGTCAAAAAKAAAIVLARGAVPKSVEVALPGGRTISVPVLYARLAKAGGEAAAAVRKDAGDDPDVTNGMEIVATVSWSTGEGIMLAAGDGIGTVTKPGLHVPPGQPAINPVPRRMIEAAVREVTDKPVRVCVSIPGGREIAAKTFNPRLGIEGGLSILGTTGIVRPYCVQALRDVLKCTLDVAAACGITAPVLVPGNIGARAARKHFTLREEQVIEVGNEWGFILDQMGDYSFKAILVMGHPGKLAKLAAGEWDTHSSRSSSAADYVGRMFVELLGRAAPDSPTVEGLFDAAPDPERRRLGDALAGRVRTAVAEHLAVAPATVAVFLVNMDRQCLGIEGDFSPWR